MPYMTKSKSKFSLLPKSVSFTHAGSHLFQYYLSLSIHNLCNNEGIFIALLHIIFCARQHKYTRTVPLSLNGMVLNQVQTTTFLGVCIDENISWNNHVNILCSTISKNVGVMNRLKYFVPKTYFVQFIIQLFFHILTMLYLHGGLLHCI